MPQISDFLSLKGSGLVKQLGILHLYKEDLIYLRGKLKTANFLLFIAMAS